MPAALAPPPELVRPDYNIYYFSDGLFKVVYNKSTAPRVYCLDHSKDQHHDTKLDSSVSRARRVVLELGLCNPWKYFCTFTLDQTKYDRTNLKKWHKDFLQWLRDQRKKYPELKFDFLLVPELHDDKTTWHMHGLFSDITPLLVSFRDLHAAGVRVPLKLVNSNYLNWTSYQKKFGFCSFGLIRDPVACGFYITKYINKSLGECLVPVGSSLYYPSRGLNRSVLHGSIYGFCSPLDKYLVNDYDFCKTGFVKSPEASAWHFGFEYMDHSDLELFDISDMECPEVDHYYEVTQQVLEGF